MKSLNRKRISFLISLGLSVYNLTGCGPNLIMPAPINGSKVVNSKLNSTVTKLVNGVEINRNLSQLKFKIKNNRVPININKGNYQSSGFMVKQVLPPEITIEELSRITALDNNSQADYAASFLDPIDGCPIVMVSYNTKGDTIAGGIQVIKIVNDQAQFLYEITRPDTEFNGLAVYNGSLYAVGVTNYVPTTIINEEDQAKISSEATRVGLVNAASALSNKATVVNNDDSRAFLMKITSTGKTDINIQEVTIPGGVGTGLRVNPLGVYATSSEFGALSHYDLDLNFISRNDKVNFAKDLDIFDFKEKSIIYVLEGGREGTDTGNILFIDPNTLEEIDTPIKVSGLGEIAAPAKASIEVQQDPYKGMPIGLVSSNQQGTRIFDLENKNELASYVAPSSNVVNHAAFIYDNTYILSAVGQMGAVLNWYDGSSSLSTVGYLGYSDKGPYSTNFLSKIKMPSSKDFETKAKTFPYMYAAGLGNYGFALLSIKPKDTISFNLDAYSLNEDGSDNGTGKVTVIRTGSLIGTLKAKVSLQNNAALPTTANIDTDFSAPYVDVIFAAGESEKTVEIPMVMDGITEGNETISLLLTTATDKVTDPNVATLTISDSNGPPLVQK